MTTKIDVLLGQPDQIVGKRLNVCGHVVVTAPANSHLTPDYESFLNGAFVRLDDDGAIGNKLNATLPPYGGGRCIYDEEISVTGRVVRTESGLELQDLSDIKITRGEMEVVV